MKTKITKNWPAGSASKTATLFFGYQLANEEHQRTYRIVINRLLHLALDNEVQILYMDNEAQERRVVVFRFVSGQSYDQYRDELVQTAGDLEKGVWEPNRDAEQYSSWKAELAEATPTLFL